MGWESLPRDEEVGIPEWKPTRGSVADCPVCILRTFLVYVNRDPLYVPDPLHIDNTKVERKAKKRRDTLF